MIQPKKYKWTLRMCLTILPVVVVMILIFFLLTSRSIISVTKQNMSLYTDNCLEQLNNWTNSVLRELEIYKDVIESNFNDDDDKLLDFVKTTYEANEAYPMGIYIGDETGFYADASGWVPDDDWVLVERPWYVGGKNSEEFSFGEPYVDSMLNKPCISASARLDRPDRVRVMTADIYLDYAQDLVDRITSENVIDGAIFINDVGDDHIIMADSDGDMTGKQLINGDGLHAKFNELIKAHSVGQNEIKSGGVSYYVTVRQLEQTGWFIITYVKKRTILGSLYKVEMLMALVAIAATIILTFETRWYARKLNHLQKKAKTDKLTGIFNREGFEEVVKEGLEVNCGKGAMIMMDMDNFKTVNDTLGHPVGDKVLKEFAEIIETFFNRKTDSVARLGGDEFIVYLGAEISTYSLKSMLVRFRQQVRDHFMVEYGEYNISTSIGAAFIVPDLSFSEMYKIVDQTLYDVKKSGKNSFMIRVDENTVVTSS